MVTVRVYHRFTSKLGKREIFRLTLQDLAQEEGLPAQPPGRFVSGKEIRQLVTKHRDATGLQTYHRHSRRNLCPQRLENLPELPLSKTEHPVIVKRTATAQRLWW